MKKFNIKLIISGFAFILFAIIIAIMSKNDFTYVIGGLGLTFVLIGCFAKDEEQNKE